MRGPRRINERAKLYLTIQSTGSGKGYSPNKGRGKAIFWQWLANEEVVNICTSSPFPPLGKYLKVTNACQKQDTFGCVGPQKGKSAGVPYLVAGSYPDTIGGPAGPALIIYIYVPITV
jgi:hypothetical protein